MMLGQDFMFPKGDDVSRELEVDKEVIEEL